MKAIKIAVAIMTVLLVFGFAVVIYTISTRLSDGTLSKKSDETEMISQTQTINKGAGSLVQGFGSVEIIVPAGCRLADAQLQGNTVLFRFDGELTRDCQRVDIYNAGSGAQIGGWQVGVSGN